MYRIRWLRRTMGLGLWFVARPSLAARTWALAAAEGRPTEEIACSSGRTTGPGIPRARSGSIGALGRSGAGGSGQRDDTGPFRRPGAGECDRTGTAPGWWAMGIPLAL